MKIFDDFHIEEYFHRFFFSWSWILNLFHFILFYIQWLVISFWSFSLMKQSYWKKWLLMIELFEKFWKVVVFRRQVCHNQYWLHTDYKPESIKKKCYQLHWILKSMSMHREKIFMLMIQSFFWFNNFINENVELYEIIRRQHTRLKSFSFM